MLKLIYGPKGFGKTKLIIDEANEKSEIAKGSVVFINDTKRYLYDLAREIKVFDTEDYGINCAKCLDGFIKGIVARDFDLHYLFIDGIARIAGKDLKYLKFIFDNLDKLAKEHNLEVVLTISSEKANLPKYLLKYID